MHPKFAEKIAKRYVELFREKHPNEAAAYVDRIIPEGDKALQEAVKAQIALILRGIMQGQ